MDLRLEKAEREGTASSNVGDYGTVDHQECGACDVAAKRLGIEVECTQEHWADEQGRKLPIHGYEERRWRHLGAFQF